MDTFRIEDLIYEYTWSPYEKDDPRISGIPDTMKLTEKKVMKSFILSTS
jgi:hypothetical protein